MNVNICLDWKPRGNFICNIFFIIVVLSVLSVLCYVCYVKNYVTSTRLTYHVKPEFSLDEVKHSEETGRVERKKFEDMWQVH